MNVLLHNMCAKIKKEWNNCGTLCSDTRNIRVRFSSHSKPHVHRYFYTVQ
ncbi:Uncharacterized protein APZ42_008079 [Daphnia magna]|uniref:Uncharacterized protein n=1 Tax=Daphnia magna TaxID=35525 RepID=A0A164EVT0_9CRUS|nr:Uncharacterized protein APZ42_008079 [Daphnia magna]